MDLPDYHGGSIVNLMASLQMGLGGERHAYAPLQLLSPETVGAHRQVILWVIDGLGYSFLRAHQEAVHLNAALRGRMTSVYPPTTASAITTFLTGEAPQQHGLTGWFVYFRELGTVLSVLPGRTRFGGVGYGGGGIDVGQLLAHRPFVDRIPVESYNLSPAMIASSEFNRVHLGRATRIGFRSLQELCDATLEITRKPGKRYLYIYWPELDEIGHHAGIRSAQAGNHLQLLDQAFDRLCQGLRGTDTLLLVCADHGQVDCAPDQTFLLDDYPAIKECLVLPLCGEPRSAYCYLRPGWEDRFDERVAETFNGLATAYSSSTVVGQNWFGLGPPHPRLQDRVGDRVVLLHQQALFRDWLPLETPHPTVGVHGGLSDAELWVPLVSASC